MSVPSPGSPNQQIPKSGVVTVSIREGGLGRGMVDGDRLFVRPKTTAEGSAGW
jgi:hypothetical protein